MGAASRQRLAAWGTCWLLPRSTAQPLCCLRPASHFLAAALAPRRAVEYLPRLSLLCLPTLAVTAMASWAAECWLRQAMEGLPYPAATMVLGG